MVTEVGDRGLQRQQQVSIARRNAAMRPGGIGWEFGKRDRQRVAAPR
ncbi:MAG: hypothetical protein U0841_06295 [Chloroflexia bacterium]